MRFKRIILVSLLLCGNTYLIATENNDNKKNKRQRFEWFFKARDWYNQTFENVDSAYVYNPKWKMSVQLLSDNYIDFQNVTINQSDFENTENDNKTQKKQYHAALQSSLLYNLGASFTFQPFTISYYFSLNDLLGRKNSIQKYYLRLSNSMLIGTFEYYNNKITEQNRPTSSLQSDIPDNLSIDKYMYQSINANAHYVFNYKQYNQSACYSFSRIQLKSAGSALIGIDYSWQDMQIDLMATQDNLIGKNNFATHSFCISGGYGYNAVIPLKRKSTLNHLCFNITILPRVGLRRAFFDHQPQYQFAFNPAAKIGMAYNYKRFFCGIQANHNGQLNFHNRTMYSSIILNFKANIGVRF